MGVAGVIAMVVIFIGFPLLVYASFRIVLSADRNDQDSRPDPDSPPEPDGQDRREGS